MNIKKKLMEELGDRVITKLAVFDFDSTLVNTPLPKMVKKGKEVVATSPTWEEKTGEKWPHKGWWGRKDSLNMDVFDMTVNQEVVDEFKKAKDDPNTLTVMMTGRVDSLSDEVKEVLKSEGLLNFDEYKFNTGGESGVIKIKQLDELLEKYPSITTVEMWDDRDKHIPRFQAWGDSKQDIKFKITHVKGGHSEEDD